MPPSSEQYAQLAALFTTCENDDVATSIELLLPAHLPVQGGLWLVPYAGREAAQGTSILVRMHDDTIDVAVLGQGNYDVTSCVSMEDVLQEINAPNIHWVVQPPTDADPTSLLHCDADRVTLLSGADQAAVVGAYRLLKGLITTSGDANELPNIQLVIVGAEEKAATDAATRIVQTAHHQLGVHVEVGTALPAMGSSTKVISQVSFPRGSNVVDLLGRIRNGETTEEACPTTTRFAKPVVPVIPEPSTEVASEAVIQPESIDQRINTTVAVNETATYASYVDGLLAITPRCPEHEHVELAVDSNGCLHILADAQNIRDISIVSAWAARHYALLAMACGGLCIDTTTSPVQHLFTSDAVSVVDLYGTGLRMHLLTDIEVDGQLGKFCTPLNK
jgi:hypothetical protein